MGEHEYCHVWWDHWIDGAVAEKVTMEVAERIGHELAIAEFLALSRAARREQE